MGSVHVFLELIFFSLTRISRASLPTQDQLEEFQECWQKGNWPDYTSAMYSSDEAGPPMPACVQNCPNNSVLVGGSCVSPEIGEGVRLGITFEYVCKPSQDCAWMGDAMTVSSGARVRMLQFFQIPAFELKGVHVVLPGTNPKLDSFYMLRKGEPGFLQRRLSDQADMHLYIALRADSKRIRVDSVVVQEIMERNSTIAAWFFGLPVEISNASLAVGLPFGDVSEDEDYQLIYQEEGEIRQFVMLGDADDSTASPTTITTVTTQPLQTTKTSTTLTTTTTQPKLIQTTTANDAPTPAPTTSAAGVSSSSGEESSSTTTLVIGLCIIAILLMICGGVMLRKRFKRRPPSEGPDVKTSPRTDLPASEPDEKPDSASSQASQGQARDQSGGARHSNTNGSAGQVNTEAPSRDADRKRADHAGKGAPSGRVNTEAPRRDADRQSADHAGKGSDGHNVNANRTGTATNSKEESGRKPPFYPGSARQDRTSNRSSDGSPDRGARQSRAGSKDSTKTASATSPPDHPVGKSVDDVELDLDDMRTRAVDVELKEMRNRGSSIEERRRYFQQMCKKWHPDKNPDSREESTKVFQHLQDRKDWFLS